MSIYDEMQAVVREVMPEFKQGVISYVALTPGNGPVDDPGQAEQTRHTVNGAATGVQYKYVMNGQAVASDLQIVSPVDPAYVPDMRDFIEIDSVPHKIVAIMPKPAAGTPVAYVFIVRRGM